MIQGMQLTVQQKMQLSAQMIQSMNLMTMPMFELREAILNEAAKNPAIEIVKDPIESKMSGFNRYSAKVSAEGYEASDKFQSILENIPEFRIGSLQTYLIEQVNLLKIDEDIAELARLIIQNLDNNGFNIVPIDELIASQNNQIQQSAKTKLQKALYIVQGLDPEGCAVNSIQETLILQVEKKLSKSVNEEQSVILKQTVNILKKHFDCIKNRNPQHLEKALKVKGVNISSTAAEDIMGIILSLNPQPGNGFSNEAAYKNYISPDAEVIETEEGLSAIIKDEQLPVIKIASDFCDFIEKGKNQKSKTKEEKKNMNFAKSSVMEAKWFINALGQREQTLLKIVRTIILFQKDFFLYGQRYLKPLQQQTIAKEIDMAASTVSRALKNKYLLCKWGIFEMNYFIASGIQQCCTAEDIKDIKSEAMSKETVKLVIQELINNSPKNLSDQKIAEALKEKGISISRRTVNKYRNELNIASSYSRF